MTVIKSTFKEKLTIKALEILKSFLSLNSKVQLL